MIFICYYLEREVENYKDLKFHVNNSSHFKLNAALFFSSFKRRPPISAVP